MIAQLDWTAVGTLGAVCLSIVIGGLTMAYRLGRLEEKVNDVRSDVTEIRAAINEEVRQRIFRERRRH